MNIITMNIADIRPYEGRDSRPPCPKTKGCPIVTHPSRDCDRNFYDERTTVVFSDGRLGHGAQKINIVSPRFDDVEIGAVGDN